jgi:GxxExxY protein
MNTGIEGEEYSLKKLTRKVIDCAREVRRQLSNERTIDTYQEALNIEMSRRRLLFSSIYEIQGYYKGEPVITNKIIFLVEGKIMVQIKTVIRPEDIQVVRDYLELNDIDRAILFHFDSEKLRVKHVKKPTVLKHNFQKI